MKLNILGTDYELSIRLGKDDPKLQEYNDGYTDFTTKEMVVEDTTPVRDDPGMKGDLALYEKQVMRHEIVHAFLFESGLDAGAKWAMNEEIIDWFAIQMPKIIKACKEADAL